MQNSLLGEISMFEDNVIASTAVNAGKNYSAKVLGCHAKNVYTEEVSKVNSIIENNLLRIYSALAIRQIMVLKSNRKSFIIIRKLFVVLPIRLSGSFSLTGCVFVRT
jgi:hypothetical protein